MKFVRYEHNDSPGQIRVGVLRDDEIKGGTTDLTIENLLQDGPDRLLEAGEQIWQSSTAEHVSIDSVALRIPVRPPQIRDCLSFLEHARNARRARGVPTDLEPEWFEMPPFYFSSVVDLLDATSPVARPDRSVAFDYEVEMAAVICGGGRNISAESADAVIAGYVLFCDWSARDFQAKERVMRIGQGKSKDMGTTLGPVLVTADEMNAVATTDGFAFEATVHINGAEISRGTFEGMHWSYGQLIEHVSRSSRLVPGDLIAGGTIPFGCLLEFSGFDSFRGWLEPGDLVEIDAGLLGRVSSRITTEI